jgi:Tol biopolymer transport system component
MSILTRPRPPRAADRTDAEALEALIEEARRRARRRRRGYAAAALVAAAAGLLGFYGFNGGGTTRAQDRDDPPPLPQATNVFAQVRGWIVHGDEVMEAVVSSCAGNPWCADEVGIWAVDPTRPDGDARDRVQLRETPAVPLDWSEDGTKLLIEEPDNEQGWLRHEQGWWRLVILNADGTETTVLPKAGRAVAGASLSPDGSQVAWSSSRLGEESRDTGIYVIGTDGGRPHLLRKGGRRQWYSGPPGSDGWARTDLFNPEFSPDGTKIAYFDGMGDWGNSLRVMNADGSHVRVLLDSNGRLSDRIVALDFNSLVWSPDGSRLAFQAAGGIWVIGVDGSGLTKLIPNGEKPSWSPDGSRIAYQVRGSTSSGPLRIADADGGNVQKVTLGYSGPWNPLEPTDD